MDADDDAPIVADEQPVETSSAPIELVDVVIPDDIEVIPDDVVPEDPDEPEEGTDASEKKPLFGYDINLNEDGTENKKEKEVILTKDIMKTGLSHVARTLDTHEYAYSCYDGQNLDLTNIDVLKDYVHLRCIDLTKNRIRDCQALSTTKHLMVLVVAENLIESFDAIPDLPLLQVVSLGVNKLKKLDKMRSNSFTSLQLSFNNIESLRGLNERSCSLLSTLELRGNNLTDLKGLELPTLEKLYVADNGLTDIGGLKGCPKLTLFHARDNKISSLEDFPSLEFLEYVNLRNNHLEDFNETKHLGNSPNISILICLNNPVHELKNYRKELLSANQNLKRLDKEPVTESELTEAKQMLIDKENGVVSESDTEITKVQEELEGEDNDETVPELTPGEEKAEISSSEDVRQLKGMNLKKMSIPPE